MSHAGLLLAPAIQCSSTSTMFAMFTTRRTHSLVQCEATFTYTHARANTMDTAATVTEPLVTPFWGLSVVQVINTDLHIVFLFFSFASFVTHVLNFLENRGGCLILILIVYIDFVKRHLHCHR